MDAWDRWRAAQVQLAEAISAFSDACVALEAAVNNPLGQVLDPLSADAATLNVYTFLPAFPNYFERLAHSRVLLRRISNSSTTLLPINVLPTEILTYVFSLAISASCSISSDKSYVSKYTWSARGSSPGSRKNPLVSIMQTSSRWRQVILNTRSFWSHVDVHPHKYPTQTAVLSESTLNGLRLASGAPIHLHFSPQLLRSQLCGSDIAAPLRPYLPNVVSLEFDPKCSLVLIQTIFDAYSSSGPSGRLTSFVYPRHTRRSEDNEPSVLKWPLRHLAGIVDLTLGNLGESNLALHQMASVFASAPRIRTLRLFGITFQPTEGEDHPVPINLPDLQVLDINSHTNYSATCFKILSIIAPGLSGLDLRLQLPIPQADCAIARSFLLRSNTKSFTCKLYEGTDTDTLTQCISFLPNLRGVFLISCAGSRSIDPVPIDFLLFGIGHGYAATFNPTINVIGLVGSRGWSAEGVGRIKEVVKAYSLDLLVFGSECSPYKDHPGLATWLSQHVKHVSKPRSLFTEGWGEYNRFIQNYVL